jgi:mRNA-degrading endonuclease HigB of HigAB toxin-antitoxin module
MKLTFSLILIMIGLNANAETVDLELKKCFSKARRYYRLNGQASDQPLEFNMKEYLKSGETLKDSYGKNIAIFNEDRLIYEVNGSYYSGYFVDYIVVDPKNCEGEIIFNVYSE